MDFPKSGFALGGGQYRNAVASGELRPCKRISVQRQTRRYRVTVLTSSNNGF